MQPCACAQGAGEGTGGRGTAHRAFPTAFTEGHDAMNGWIRAGIKDKFFRRACCWLLAAAAAVVVASAVHAQEAEWIWSPEHAKEGVPTGEACHFRKTMNLRAPEGGQVVIAADDQYELYINGRRIGAGEATKKLDEYEISKFLSRGTNVIAVRVQNATGKTAALVARVTIKDGGEW